MFTIQWYSETGLFRYLYAYAFRNPEFGKYMKYEGHLPFENVQVLCRFQNCSKKSRKDFLFLR